MAKPDGFSQEEAKRMQNIRDGIGCPHGREKECVVCDSVKEATKRFKEEFENARRDQ